MLKPGTANRNSAATPATCGAAIDVPLFFAVTATWQTRSNVHARRADLGFQPIPQRWSATGKPGDLLAFIDCADAERFRERGWRSHRSGGWSGIAIAKKSGDPGQIQQLHVGLKFDAAAIVAAPGITQHIGCLGCIAAGSQHPLKTGVNPESSKPNHCYQKCVRRSTAHQVPHRCHRCQPMCPSCACRGRGHHTDTGRFRSGIEPAKVMIGQTLRAVAAIVRL